MSQDTTKKPDALSRAQVRQQLAQLPAKRRLDALISASDAPRLVRSVPAEELYFTVAEVGLSDAQELVQLASPAQFRTFVDLGAWRSGELDPHGLLTWLRAARGDGGEDFLRKLHGLDLELFEALLRRFIEVHDLEETPDVNPEGVTMETPEGRYLLEFREVEGAELAGLRQLLNDLIAENPFEAVRLIEAARWEVPTELEETALRFRSARLGDLGFPPLEEAVSIYAWADPAPFEGQGPAAPDAAGLAPAAERTDFVAAALDGLDADEREAASAELRALANAALVADVADPGDLDAVRRVAEGTRDMLGLGLELLARGDPARAAQAVRDTPLKRVFQLGFSLTLRLKRRADRLAQAHAVLLLLPEEAAALEALRRKRPRRALKVEGAEPVPFRSLRELAQSEATLARAEAQAALLTALLGRTKDAVQTSLARLGEAGPTPDVTRVLAAAVATAVLDGRAAAEPVPAGRTVELGERLFEGDPDAPRLRPGALPRALAPLEPLAGPDVAAREEVRRVVERTLARLLEELGVPYLREGRLDPVLAAVLPLG